MTQQELDEVYRKLESFQVKFDLYKEKIRAIHLLYFFAGAQAGVAIIFLITRL